MDLYSRSFSSLTILLVHHLWSVRCRWFQTLKTLVYMHHVIQYLQQAKELHYTNLKKKKQMKLLYYKEWNYHPLLLAV